MGLPLHGNDEINGGASHHYGYKGVSEEQDVDNRNAGYGILFTASTKKWEKTKNPARLAGKLGLAGILADGGGVYPCNVTAFIINTYTSIALR